MRQRTRQRPNSVKIPRPRPVSIHRSLTTAGRDLVGNEFSSSWAMCRTREGSVVFRAMYLYARRSNSFDCTAWRAAISRLPELAFAAYIQHTRIRSHTHGRHERAIVAEGRQNLSQPCEDCPSKCRRFDSLAPWAGVCWQTAHRRGGQISTTTPRWKFSRPLRPACGRCARICVAWPPKSCKSSLALLLWPVAASACCRAPSSALL